MNKKQIVKLFVENPSRMSMGSGKLSKRWNCTPSDIHLARREARAIINTNNSKLSCDKPGNNRETFKVTLKESWFKNMPSQSSPKKSLSVGMHIVSGCWHVPFQNKRMQKGLLQLIEDLGDKVKGFHLIGDVLDVNSLSAHEPNKVPMKGITLGYEYKEGNKFLDEFEQVLPKDVEKTFIWGNHENRWTRHVADINISKYADALPSPTEALHLNERGYKVYENWKEDYHFLGKDLQLIHGEFCSKYPARTHVDRMKASVMFAHCFSEDTEVLTSIGWKYFPDISEKDLVSTINLKTGNTEFNKINSYHKYDNYTKLTRFSGHGMDLMVTDEHCMIKKQGKKLVREEANKLSTKNWSFPNGGINPNSDFEISDDILKLIGWIVTDGNYQKDRNGENKYVRIKQCNKKKVGIKHITNILDNLKQAYTIGKNQPSENYNCYDIYINTSPLLDSIIKLIPNKKLEYWMLNLSKRQFDVLLNEIILGDGSFYGKNAMQYVTGNKSDVDIMQALCVTNGYRTSVLDRNNYWTIAINKRKYTKFSSKNSEIVDYIGEVYCLSVDNQSLIVRRNGKTSVCGNTHRIDINYDGEKAGFNIGWGGDVNSEAFNYVSRLTKMNWINGFALVHIDEKGNYFTQVIPVFNNEFWYNGKKYE